MGSCVVETGMLDTFCAGMGAAASALTARVNNPWKGNAILESFPAHKAQPANHGRTRGEGETKFRFHQCNLAQHVIARLELGCHAIMRDTKNTRRKSGFKIGDVLRGVIRSHQK
jgi:hypothetical protein